MDKPEGRSLTAARGWVTRAVSQIEKAASKPDLDFDVLEAAVENFDKRVSTLDESQEEYERIIEDEKELLAAIDNAADFREKAFESRVRAVKLIKRSEKGSPVDSKSTYGESSAKLPKLVLPSFSGECTQWQGFWDQFQAVVGYSDLADVTKFTYLLSLLRGEAKAAVTGLTLSSKHYLMACEILQKRFGRPEKIIFSHVQELLNLPIPKSVDVSSLWKLYNELQVHIRSLETLRITGEQYGVILTPLILSRLPTDLRLEWAREGESHESDLEYLIFFLEKEIRRRERSSTFVKARTEPAEFKSARPSTAAALQVQSKRETCLVCKGSHSTEKCFKLTKVNMSERQAKVQELGLCFRCLGNGHIARKCKVNCRDCGCGRNHHYLLCDLSKKGKPSTPPNTEAGSVNNLPVVSPTTVLSSTCSTTHIKDVILQIARVQVTGNNGPMELSILFDTGSDRSYVTSKVVRRLRPEFERTDRVAYAAFGSSGVSKESARNVYRLPMDGLDGVETILATEVQSICAPLLRQSVPLDLLQSLGEVQFADSYDTAARLEIDVLVGLDNYWRLIKPVVVNMSPGLVAQESKFGWILSGITGTSESSELQTFTQLLCVTDIPDGALQNFWNLESIGVSPVIENSPDRVLNQFNETIKFTPEGRYSVKLPWKENHASLGNNHSIAQRRLASLTRRLSKDPDLAQKYHATIAEMRDQGIIEEVPPESQVEGPVYYMPHRPVVKESSLTTKIRPVFDASAKGYNGVSLNDCLETGPCLLPSLVDIIMRFRRWRIAITADITKAFLQVLVDSQDRDVHRFLWNDGGNQKVMRFLRLPFGNCSSPFLLNASIRHHISQYPESRTVSELKDNLYCDDLLTGADSEKDAALLFKEARSILGDASMPLAKYSSNSDSMTLMFREVDGKYTEISSTKILGLFWDTKSDTFGFSGVDIPNGLVVTKRVILSFLARMFDPLGLIIPFLMVVKILIQDIWMLGVDWDQELPEIIGRRFLKWLDGLETLRNWSVPRCFSSSGWSDCHSVELHAFGDASERAYGSVVYLRVPTSSDEFEVSLVMSRGRVAPVKTITLPRLELLAALLTARLVTHVIKALQLSQVKYICYTDSMVSLGWIRGDATRWKAFVANRVVEIQQLTPPSCWRHCVGTDNPADMVSRGVNADTLAQSSLWLHGPDWLKRPCDSKGLVDDNALEHYGGEERKSSATVLMQQNEPALVEFERYGSFLKAIRVIGWISRFTFNARASLVDRRSGDLSFEELTEAKLRLFKIVQRQSYERELEVLRSGKLVQSSSSIAKLRPFIDENGLIRMRSRLQHSDLQYEEKFPIIVPKSHVALLLVRYQHRLMKHSGVDTMITTLRSTYWVVGLRQTAKKVKGTCVSCQRQDNSPCDQATAPLPEFRVKPAPAFSTVGIDHAGPLYSSDHPGVKHYILLFTCAVIRAVHLELVDSLSSKDTMLALRRFCSRRGLPAIIYSDNAKNFQACQRELNSFYGPVGPKWQMIAPLSPWWGGFWERQVRSVKSALKKSVGGGVLTRTELETTLLEVEHCINSRPLTFVGDEKDAITPLTPSHFLIGRGSGFHPPPTAQSYTLTSEGLIARYGMMEEVLNSFWQVWSLDYLRNLPPGSDAIQKGDLRVGSVVLIRDEKQPRIKWNLGVVQKLFPGRDGLVRAVEVKTATSVLTRSVQCLHLLEVAPSKLENLLPPSNQSEASVQAEPPHAPSPRPVGKLTRSGRKIKAPQRLDL